MSQRILITGANRGIGLALTRELLGQGNKVIAACRNTETSLELKDLASMDHDALSVVKLDVLSDESVLEAVAAVEAKGPALDVLVNNAAIFPEEGNESIEQMDIRHFGAAFETNVVGTARVTRAFLPLLGKGKNPRIVNISSGAGSISDKEDSAYYAYSTSKAALNMVTRAMAAELKPRKIAVVALSPGWVKTDMGGPNAPLTPEESAQSIARTIANLSMQQTSLFLDRDGETSEYGW